MRAAIYTRVSTDEQAKEGLSMEVQERDCRAYAARQGYTVVGLYDDPGFSGVLESRPSLDRLFADAEVNRFDVILTWKFDRLYRVVEYQKRARREMTERGILWQSATEIIDIYTPSGNLQHSIHATFAEWERDVIRERTIAGRHQRARNGRQTIMQRPFGYRIITHADARTEAEHFGKDGEYVLIPEEAEAVRLVFRRCMEGKTLWRIAEELKNLGVKTMRGGAWRAGTIQQMLRNPVYKGTAYHARYKAERVRDPKTQHLKKVSVERPESEWIAIPCPAIVDQETFDYAQTILTENKVRKSGNAKRVYPLSNLIRCAKCGRPYGGMIANEGKHRYYRPRPRSFPEDPGCKSRPWVADRAEESVLSLLSHVAQNPEVMLVALKAYWEEEREARGTTSEREKLEEQLRKTDQQLRALIEREIADPELSDIHADLKMEKKIIRRELQQKLAALPQESVALSQPVLKDIQEVCSETARRLSEIKDATTMREVFLQLVEVCEVEEDGNILVRLFPGKLSLTSRR